MNIGYARWVDDSRHLLFHSNALLSLEKMIFHVEIAFSTVIAAFILRSGVVSDQKNDIVNIQLQKSVSDFNFSLPFAPR